MRPHFQYAAHQYCNGKFAADKRKEMGPHTREFVKQFNASIKNVLGLKKAMSHRRISIIMGKFAATPMIAKSFEITMMRYHERFIKADPNVDKELINH